MVDEPDWIIAKNCSNKENEKKDVLAGIEHGISGSLDNDHNHFTNWSCAGRQVY